MNLKYIYPEGAFYIFIKVDEFFNSTIKNSLDFCDFLLSYYNVALIPGVVFGEDNFVRMSYATKIDDIKLGISILKKFINEL